MNRVVPLSYSTANITSVYVIGEGDSAVGDAAAFDYKNQIFWMMVKNVTIV